MHITYIYIYIYIYMYMYEAERALTRRPGTWARSGHY